MERISPSSAPLAFRTVKIFSGAFRHSFRQLPIHAQPYEQMLPHLKHPDITIFSTHFPAVRFLFIYIFTVYFLSHLLATQICFTTNPFSFNHHRIRLQPRSPFHQLQRNSFNSFTVFANRLLTPGTTTTDSCTFTCHKHSILNLAVLLQQDLISKIKIMPCRSALLRSGYNAPPFRFKNNLLSHPIFISR